MSDTWVDAPWSALHFYDGGWTYPECGYEGGQSCVSYRERREQVEDAFLQHVQLGGPNAAISAHDRRACLQNCLEEKGRAVVTYTATVGSAGLFGCSWAASSFVLSAYLTCVAGMTVAGAVAGLVSEFVTKQSCDHRC
ncbi:MAG: hypothetical protein KJ066_13115 [Acidobacteria bacterium]|nr:hypothetical protein [Acidobacteriota bacterium]